MKSEKNLKQKNRCACGRWRTCHMAAALLLGAVIALAVPAAASAEEKPSFLRSVLYTGNEWIDNFWSTEMEQLDEDMARIAADGFNSIILAVPWCEFQPDLKPAAYNLYAFERLDEVMEAAETQGLWVQLRVSYTWDYTDYAECRSRFRRLLTDQEARSAWVSYMRLVYATAAEHENFYGGFIAGEDLRNALDDSDRGLSASQYFESYVEFQNQLLKLGQEVFPGLSAEVCPDAVSALEKTENDVDQVLKSVFSCGDAAYTCMLFRASVEKASDAELTAGEALDAMAGLLARVKSINGGKPIYIDHLLYMDEENRFPDAVWLSESERAAYLTGLAPVLKKHTNGYGVWNYRNYVNNSLYNSQFALEDSGWEASLVQFRERNGSMTARLEPKGRLSQKCGARISGRKEKDNYVRFTADSDRAVTLTVALGTKRKDIRIEGRGEHILNFGRLDYDQIAFSADGDVYLDNIQVYNTVLDGQLYDQDGNELSCIAAVRGLNAALE